MAGYVGAAETKVGILWANVLCWVRGWGVEEGKILRQIDHVVRGEIKNGR